MQKFERFFRNSGETPKFNIGDIVSYSNTFCTDGSVMETGYSFDELYDNFGVNMTGMVTAIYEFYVNADFGEYGKDVKKYRYAVGDKVYDESELTILK